MHINTHLLSTNCRTSGDPEVTPRMTSVVTPAVTSEATLRLTSVGDLYGETLR